MRQQASPGIEGWIFDEDMALRRLLDNIYVSDDKNPKRRVGVWFGHPDKEIRDQKYPYITLDLVDISEEKDRAERGHYTTYTPQWPLASGLLPAVRGGGVPKEAVAVTLDMPIPISLMYQISTWARNPRHDRQLLQALLQRGLTRFQKASLSIADNTVRRLDVINMLKRDTVSDDRRLFNNVIMVAVSSEVPWSSIDSVRDVQSVKITLGYAVPSLNNPHPAMQGIEEVLITPDKEGC